MHQEGRVLFATTAATTKKKNRLPLNTASNPQANISPIKNFDNPSSMLAEKRI